MIDNKPVPNALLETIVNNLDQRHKISSEARDLWPTVDEISRNPKPLKPGQAADYALSPDDIVAMHPDEARIMRRYNALAGEVDSLSADVGKKCRALAKTLDIRDITIARTKEGVYWMKLQYPDARDYVVEGNISVLESALGIAPRVDSTVSPAVSAPEPLPDGVNVDTSAVANYSTTASQFGASRS